MSRARQRHLVLVHRYFYPDTPPYASILREIALALGEAGHRVTVLTCQPSYNRSVVSRAPRREDIGIGVTVRRWAVMDDRQSRLLKLINLMVFCLRLLLTIPRLGHIDVVMAASTPPVGVARTAQVVGRRVGARFVYHHQDIWPEVAQAEGSGRASILVRMLRRVDATTDRRSDAVVVLSRDMARLIESRDVDAARVKVINNFDPWDLVETPSGFVEGDRLRVVYAGNLGRFQNLDVVFEAMASLRECDALEWHFFGGGPREQELRELVADGRLGRVHLHGHVAPDSLASFLLTSADVGLVSLNPGVIAAAFPSKTMSYLRNGVPVLSLVERGSELAQLLDSYQAGWQADPRSPEELSALISRLQEGRDEVRAARAAALRMYNEEFRAAVMLPLWVGLFEETCG